MEKPTFMRTASTLLAVLFGIMQATTSLLVGQDTYLVRQPAISLPSISRPERSVLVERPNPGTYVPGQLLVKTRTPHGLVSRRTSIDGSVANIDLENLNVSTISSAFQGVADKPLASALGIDRMYTVQYNAAIDPFDACAKMMDNPDVEYAVPVYIHKMFFTPNDTRYSSQPWMGSMKVDKAWDVTKGSATVLIAIIDSGTDWQHEDLAANIWTNTKEIPGNGLDDDGNGFIDDVRGWDFVGNVSLADVQGGIVRPDNDPRVTGQITDVTGHGTVVGGCSGAVTNNAKGIAGAGFNCRLIPIKCGSDNPSFGGILRGYEAISYAADLGAHVINCSWGGGGLQPGGQEIVDYATAKGSLVIAASGNDGLDNDAYLQSPASLENVLSVGSCSVQDRVSGFSNFGMNVDVYAPGENILSTYPNNQYRSLNGTSFSSPLVAGIAGLIKAVHPDWTPDMIAAQIRSTADPLIGISTDNRPKYWGRINAERAVKVNTTFTSGERTPGLVLAGTSVGTGAVGRINSYAKTKITITMKNLLSDAQNVVITPRVITPLVQYTGGPTIALGNLAHSASDTASFELQLSDNFPWYSTSVVVSLSISSGTYVNHEAINIPVELPTTNTHQILASVPSSSWSLVDFTSDGTLYAAGTYFGQRAIIRALSSGAGGLVQHPFVASCIKGVSASTILIGGINAGTASVTRSQNGGQAWSTLNVSSIATSVNGITMFDAQAGLFVGSPFSGKFGIGVTTNGGTNWTLSSTAPPSNLNETVLPGSVHFRGNAVWFATSTNRVIGSLNKGQSWLQGSLGVSGASIRSIAFRDSSNGIIMYTTGSGGAMQYRISSSTNGGISWRTEPQNINSLGFTPLAVLGGSNHHLLVGTNGAVFGSDNNGGNWQSVLSKPAGAVLHSAAFNLARPTLFVAGEQVSMLQYRYSGPNGTKIPQFTTSQLGFGTIDQGQGRTRTATLRNLGESDLTITSFETSSVGATPANAFSITAPPRTSVTAGGSISIPLRCEATDTGSYEGRLIIKSDGTPATIELPLFALVVMPVSVMDFADTGISTFWPNPASSTLTIQVSGATGITIASTDGRVVHTGTLESGTQALDVSTLPTGAYHIILLRGRSVRSFPLTIVR